MKDQVVIEKIQQGDESAIDYLYTKYYKMMTKMVIKNSGTEDEAQDIYQDALVVFWQKVTRKELVLTSRISTYLYSICQNLWRKELDRKKRLSGEMTERSEVIDFDRKEKHEIIHRCISELGETCKKVLTYYYFDGRSMKEIAELLEFANADTAKTKKYKCKKELDKRIKSQYSAGDFIG